MSKLDTKKVAKAARDKVEWIHDQRPPKSLRTEKRKERQDGKSEIRKELKVKECNWVGCKEPQPPGHSLCAEHEAEQRHRRGCGG